MVKVEGESSDLLYEAKGGANCLDRLQGFDMSIECLLCLLPKHLLEENYFGVSHDPALKEAIFSNHTDYLRVAPRSNFAPCTLWPLHQGWVIRQFATRVSDRCRIAFPRNDREEINRGIHFAPEVSYRLQKNAPVSNAECANGHRSTREYRYSLRYLWQGARTNFLQPEESRLGQTVVLCSARSRQFFLS